MKSKYLLYVLLAAITIFGLVTGRYLLLVFMLPVGWLWKPKKGEQ